MEIVEDYVFPQGRGWNWPEYLIIHETANPGATALNHVNFWASGEQGGEAHYVTDWTGIVYHTTPDDRATWNVGGNANSWTVGIELCHATNQADFEAVWRTGVEFAAWYLNSMGWGIDRMMSHYQANHTWATFSDHTDPIGYFDEFGKTWEQFVGEVEQEMQGHGQKEEPVTYEEMEQIAELCAAKVAESAYWPEDKKEQWGAEGKGTGKYMRNSYNILRFIHDLLVKVNAKIDKISAGNVDYKALAKAVWDEGAKRMQS